MTGINNLYGPTAEELAREEEVKLLSDDEIARIFLSEQNRVSHGVGELLDLDLGEGEDDEEPFDYDPDYFY